MSTAPFDFAPLLPAGLPPAAARWTGRVKFDFTGGNNDSDRLPLDGLIAAAESVRRALGVLRLRHRPILVNLEDPDLHRLGAGDSRTAVEAFAKAGALGILAGNRKMAVKLRHGGIAVASVSAQHLAGETLRLYLRRAS